MKKLFAIMLVLCMLVPLCAVAEESTFTFRSGYHWGMTRKEVIELAEKEGLLFTDDGGVEGVEEYKNAIVGGYPAEILFDFENDELLHAFYSFRLVDPDLNADANKQMYIDLQAGLTKTYGEPAEVNEHVRGYTVRWNVADTTIAMMVRLEGEEEFYCQILYRYAPELVPTASPVPIPNDGF